MACTANPLTGAVSAKTVVSPQAPFGRQRVDKVQREAFWKRAAATARREGAGCRFWEEEGQIAFV